MRTVLCSLCVSLALAIAVGLLARPAAAAPWMEITYDVVSGTFSGPHLSGAITGGSIMWTVPRTGQTSKKGTVDSFSCFYGNLLGNYCGYIQTMHLTGTAGSFTLLQPQRLDYAWLSKWYARLRGNGNGFIAASSGGYYVNYGGVGVIQMKYPTFLSSPPTAPFSNHLGVAQVTHFFHHAILGNEVRTWVPEPSTGALLALGLGVMGVVGGGSGSLAARVRRARRR
jgi:hypothetical protein